MTRSRIYLYSPLSLECNLAQIITLFYLGSKAYLRLLWRSRWAFSGSTMLNALRHFWCHSIDTEAPLADIGRFERNRGMS